MSMDPADNGMGMAVSGRRVVVAMSGGVDSSVAALLLKQAGADVVGVTLRMKDCAAGVSTNPGGGPRDSTVSCCAAWAEEMARVVCDGIGVPHHVVDCRATFERDVLLPCWDEYAVGRTPSPCIICNERIKFGLLRRWAAGIGAGLLATGHYASVCGGAIRFLRPADRRKDQTYFLCRVVPDRGLVFPLAGLEKTRVRAIAAEHGLAVADAPDSQDACWASTEFGFSELLMRRFGGAARPGRFIDEQGRQVGRHEGIHLYTVGQARGFCIGDGRKHWVAAIDPRTADITVTADPKNLMGRAMTVKDVVVAGGTVESVCGIKGLAVVVRHGGEPVPVRCFELGDGRLRVEFDQPIRAVTPGQAAAFYDGGSLVAGGWIDDVGPEFEQRDIGK